MTALYVELQLNPMHKSQRSLNPLLKSEFLSIQSKMKDSISSAIIESMSDGLFVLDFHGYFTHINRAALKLLGIRREQIYGNTYMQVFMDGPEND